MTLLEILNQVLGQSGFLAKEVFAGTSDPDDIQMVAMANRAAVEIARFAEWGALREDYQFELDESLDTYPMPSDFLSVVSDSMWELDSIYKVHLPTPNAAWYQLKLSPLSAAGDIYARMKGGEIQVYSDLIDTSQPSNPLGVYVAFQYITKNIVEDSLGNPKPLFTADEDTFRLDEQLLILGTQYHWATAKLLPQAEAWRLNYMRRLNEAIGSSKGARTVGGCIDNDSMPPGQPYYPLWRS